MWLPVNGGASSSGSSSGDDMPALAAHSAASSSDGDVGDAAGLVVYDDVADAVAAPWQPHAPSSAGTLSASPTAGALTPLAASTVWPTWPGGASMTPVIDAEALLGLDDAGPSVAPVASPDDTPSSSAMHFSDDYVVTMDLADAFAGLGSDALVEALALCSLASHLAAPAGSPGASPPSTRPPVGHPPCPPPPLPTPSGPLLVSTLPTSSPPPPPPLRPSVRRTPPSSAPPLRHSAGVPWWLAPFAFSAPGDVVKNVGLLRRASKAGTRDAAAGQVLALEPALVPAAPDETTVGTPAEVASVTEAGGSVAGYAEPGDEPVDGGPAVGLHEAEGAGVAAGPAPAAFEVHAAPADGAAYDFVTLADVSLGLPSVTATGTEIAGSSCAPTQRDEADLSQCALTSSALSVDAPPPCRPREPRSLLMSPLTRRGRVWPGPPRRRPALGFRLGGGCSGPDRLLALRSQWVTSLRARRPALPTEPASSTAGHGTTPPGLRDLAWAAPASGACAGRCGPALLSLQSRLLSLGWASRGSGGSTARCRAGLRLAHAATASCLDAMLALTRAPSSPPKRSVWRGWPRALTLGARSSAGGIRGGSRRRRATRVARTSTSLMTAVARVCFRTSSSATRGTSSSKTTWAASTRV